MNVTPALPNPVQPPAQQGRKAVAAVGAPAAVRDDADGAARRQPTQPRAADRDASARLADRAEGLLHRSGAGSLRADRALAAYAAVADERERSELRNLLGFDAYA